MVPYSARPLDLGGATRGTFKSWIIHPSYHPDSLLITHRPEISVNTSMAARTSSGFVGRPALGSKTTRTEPIVGNCPLGPVAVGLVPSLIPGTIVVKTLGSKPAVSSR